MSLGGDRARGQTFLSRRGQCPQPAAAARNEPCVVSCAASRVIIYPPPVVVTFPGPIVATCPQEAVVGASAALEEGGCPAPPVVASLRAEIPRPEPHGRGSIPKRGPRRAPRCSYVFASRWVHPCSRAGSRSSQRDESGSGGHVAEKEEPGTENMDAGNEGKEALEEPRGETAPEAL